MRRRLQADRRREDPAQGQRVRLPDRRGAVRLAQHRRAARARRQDGKGKTIITADHIVVATGSRPIEIPGFKFDGNRIVDSTGALDFASVPERFVVIGGGYIGIEIGTLYAKLGSKVTVVEALPAILPGNDPEIVQLVARKLKKLGVEVVTGAKAKSWAEKNGRAEVTIDVGGRASPDNRGRQGAGGGRTPAELGGAGPGGDRREDRAGLRPGRPPAAHQRPGHLRHRRRRAGSRCWPTRLRTRPRWWPR